MKKISLLYAALFTCLFMDAQQLPRRPLLGIQMERITEDTKKIMALPDLKGVLISRVVPNSTAEKAGFKKGDILLELNGKEMNSPDEALKEVAASSGGSQFAYKIYRNKKIMQGKSIYAEYPKEKYKDIQVEYTAVQTTNGVQRLIVSRPASRTGRLPVLFFIGGIGCYSLDNPLDTARSETQFLNAVTRAGFICVRAEKPGVGDNQKCTPCAEVSFTEELNGYISGINAVKTMDAVDTSRVYVFGHSMGGVFAPLLAQKTNVAGIIAYGTIGSNFIEYLLKTRRTIGEAYEWKPEETDTFIKSSCECASYYFINKLSSDEAAKKNSDCKEYIGVFELRSRKYNDELYNFNIPSLWKTFEGKALLLWGSADYIASKEDHQIIAGTVNYYHPGNAVFQVAENCTHGIGRASSFAEAAKNEGMYNKQVAEQVISWLKSNA